ncbi:MAG: UDP-N-acetylmuramate--L-alanine ligase [Bacillota bacterium]|nr:UDP-N-acetylmuramate--L-alanine ligase [Bacillota bacterium]
MQIQGRIHFVGIGGHGMSAMARVLLEMGCPVSGSDVANSARAETLRAAGADVHIGHFAHLVEGAACVVVSAAVSRENVEVAAAQRLGIPIRSRAEMLGDLMNPKRGIAISGTHGKTTTSSMVATILLESGLDPTCLLGDEVDAVPGGGRFGRSDIVVAEADEAYGSFLKLWPKIAVVTNIDDDHLDHYGSSAAIDEAFGAFLSHVPVDGLAVLCADNRRLMDIEKNVKCRKVLYGLSSGDICCVDPVPDGRGHRFGIVHKGQHLGQLELGVPGRHNIANALASVAVGLEMGVPFEVMRRALAAFRGARRRQEVVGEVRGVTVVDDYGHHPTEIRVTLAALKESYGRRLLAVFQPQRFTRTRLLFDEFARSFSSADVVVITEIYHRGTGEEPIPGVSGERLAEAVRAHEGPGGARVEFIGSLHEIVPWLLSEVRPGDLVVTMGAGDVDCVARELVRRMRDDW